MSRPNSAPIAAPTANALASSWRTNAISSAGEVDTDAGCHNRASKWTAAQPGMTAFVTARPCPAAARLGRTFAAAGHGRYSPADAGQRIRAAPAGRYGG